MLFLFPANFLFLTVYCPVLFLEQMLIGLKDGAQGVGLVLSLSVAFMNTLLQSTAVNVSFIS